MPERRSDKPGLLALRRHYTHPHDLYDTLRTQSPLSFDTTSQCWLVTGHKAVTTILDDPRFCSALSSVSASTSTQMSPVSRQMLFLDGEQHRRAQNVILKPLARMVKSMPADIRGFVRRALKDVAEKGEMEMVHEIASPISLFTIAQVLGIPLEDEQELKQLEQWSDTFGDITSGYFGGKMTDVKNLEDYFRRLITRRREAPGNDLLSALIEAEEVFPDEEELIANCMMIFAAGRITTKKLLGDGISFLGTRWEAFQQETRANPQALKQLGEELLRLVTPTRYLIREASQDIDLSSLAVEGQGIRRNQRMLLFLDAANYDPTVFEHPRRMHPHRQPNKHLAFGYGPHQCPGATLARAEIQIALEELFSLAALRPKPGTSVTWNPNPNLGGYTTNHFVFQRS